MAEEKLLTVRDVSIILGISEKEVVDLTEAGKIPAYKIAGTYLRFKKEHIIALKNNALFSNPNKTEERKISWYERIADFWYFNDFYIVSFILILLLLSLLLYE